MDLSVVAGEVLWLRPDPSIGREQSGRRPAVVASNGLFHDTVTTLALVVPVTSVDRGWDNHVPLSGEHALAQQSYAMTEQVRAVSRSRIDGRAGVVDDETLHAIRRWVHDYL